MNIFFLLQLTSFFFFFIIDAEILTLKYYQSR